ncbi:2Fe-2S iron-sulfur cluster-binding protein [Brevibacillus sp. NRS-1366]|uniref:2Fe-2S iron-sulfur cluster-binding protein n=1 Tax=Brevibacillus sp. NRS-1366 TaxID=3233899 RepID=UPI003D1B5FB0
MRKQLTVGSLLPTRAAIQTASPTPVSMEPVPQTQVPTTPFSPVPARQWEMEKKQVQVKQREQSFSIPFAPCQTLLEAALAKGQPISYKCQEGYCGKCSVQVTSGDEWLDKPTLQEQTKLGKNLAAGYRLACQSRFRSTKRR